MNNRVLIVNDSKFESMILSDMLSSLGYNVKVTDEYDALRLVQVFSPDVVLVNYVMKDTFGDMLIEKIKMKSQGIKCILTSTNQIDRQEIRNSRIDAIVRTPINKSSLEGILKQLQEAKDEAATDDEEITQLKASIEKWKARKTDKLTDDRPAETEKKEAFKFCPYCGSKFDGDAGKAYAFCPQCGHKFDR